MCMQNSVLITRITILYGFQPSSVLFCIQNRDFRTRIASLSGSQTSPMTLSMKNRVLINRINCLYRSQTSSMNLCKQNSLLSTKITSLYGSQPSSVVFPCKTATLGPELQVSIGPSTHLWLVHSKQRLYNQNYRSVRVPALVCGFVHSKSVFSTRITSLYVSHLSSVHLCIQNSEFMTRINSIYESQN